MTEVTTSLATYVLMLEDLSKGKLDGNAVERPKHHARFDVITGKVVSKPKVGFLRLDIKDLKVYQVKVVDDDVMAVVE